MAKTEKEQLWARQMAEWERSGTRRRAWCAANGLSVYTFDYWRGRLRPRTVSKPRARQQRLVPVVVKSAPAAPAAAVTIEIALPGGMVLRAPATVETRWLAALVHEIGRC